MSVIRYRDAIRDAMKEEMARDEKVFLTGQDIAEFGGSYNTSTGLLDAFGHSRVRNAPLSENAIIGCALGAALAGMRPIAEIMYVDFTACCMDQIVNEAAKSRYMFGGKAKLPMVIRTQGGTGRSSAAQHAQSLESWFTHIPGIYTVMPSTPGDAKGLLKTCIRDENPVLFIEHKLLYTMQGEVPDEEYLLPLGKADIKRPGSDATILTYSMGVHWSLDAAEELSKDGINVEVIDLRSLKPLDEEAILNSVEKTGHVVIVNEAYRNTGFPSELAAFIQEQAFDALDAPIERVTGLDVSIPFSPKLEALWRPDKQKVIKAVKKSLNIT